MNAVQTTTLEDGNTDLRRHRRVDVKLQVLMRLDRTTSCITTTRNISEGGVLLRGFQGPALHSGRLVGIDLRGVLSDEDDTDTQRYLMRVVRHDGDIVALRFASANASADTAP